MEREEHEDEVLREEHEAREHLIDAEVEAQETLDEAEQLHERPPNPDERPDD
jgi:hypothetical protein